MRLAGMILVVVVLVAACGGVEQAATEASSLLRQTIDDLYPDLPREEVSYGNSGCTALGQQGFVLNINVEFEDGVDYVAIVEQVGDYWSQHGYATEFFDGLVAPIVQAESEEMTLSLSMAGSVGFFQVSTECFW